MAGEGQKPHESRDGPGEMLWVPVDMAHADEGALQPASIGDTSFELPLAQSEAGSEGTAEAAFETNAEGEEFARRFRPGPATRLALRFGFRQSRLRDAIVRQAAIERDSGSAFNWYPVWFGAGCGLYLSLPREPLAFAFPLLAVIMALLVWRLDVGSRRRGVAIALLLVALGVAAGQMRVALVDTKMVPVTVTQTITGKVAMLERRADGRVRYTLSLLEPLADGFVPGGSRVRVSARRGGTVAPVGAIVQGRARLSPPSGPAYPGGYSFAFDHWFDGLSASGFFFGAPKVLQPPDSDRWLPELAAVRSAMAGLIRDALPGRSGGLAAALIVGDRSGIDDDTAETLRRTGLAHILAISGLHMALVTATVLLCLRLALAALPGVALHYPVRKIAAVLALAAAAAYLLLSGASVSTQRAFVMIAIMLIALLADRRALTMRNVAIAALVVLAFAPESIVLPGFQMSFAAVAALVATYEVLRKRADDSRRALPQGAIARMVASFGRNMGGLALTSLVAGLATGLFAAYHFHRVAPLGLVANLGAMPLVSLLVMPMALLGAALMPFGLEQFPLSVMGFGIDGVMAVASRVAQYGPQGVTGAVQPAAMLVATAGLLVLCLLRSKLRLMGIVLLAGGLVPVTQVRVPDLLILENGAQVAMRNGGEWVLMRPRAEKFSTRIWQRAFPEEPSQGAKIRSNFTCDDHGCAVVVKGKRLAVAWRQTALREDCLLADIIVTRFRSQQSCEPVPGRGQPLMITLDRLSKRGSHALYWSADKAEFEIETAGGQHPRPWNRHRFVKR